MQLIEYELDDKFMLYMNWQKSLRALFIIAALMGRAIAWPEFKCSTVERICKEIPQHTELTDHLRRFYRTTSVPFTVADEANKCM